MGKYSLIYLVFPTYYIITCIGLNLELFKISNFHKIDGLGLTLVAVGS